MYKILIFIFLFFQFAYAKEVLLLHSYHKGYKWSDDISKAIETKLKLEDGIELTTVYMDTKRVSNPIYFKKLASLYKERFKKRNFDLIIASDNNAFEFVSKYHEYLFKDVPVLFTGINNFDEIVLDKKFMSNYVSGVVEQVDLEKNFELILKIHPKLKNLLILNDTSKTGYAVRKDLQPIIEKYKKRINIEYVDNIDITNLRQKVSELKSDTAILFVLLFKDTTGKFFTYKESFQEIKEASPVPIYGLWDFYLDFGMIGGLLTSATAQGEAVAAMALKVLNGQKITDIPILKKSPNQYIFDFNELKRFNLEIDNIVTSDYRVINKPTNIFVEYMGTILLALSIILGLLIIVMFMYSNIKHRLKVEDSLQTQIKFDQVLLNTLPNAIYHKDIYGKIQGCNQAFATLFKMKKEDALGKTAHDLYPYDLAIKSEKSDRQILKTLGRANIDLTLHFDDTMRHIILNKAVYLNAEGKAGGIVCILDDITERLQQKQFLIQQGKLAEMGDMVAAIAHQWNEPLVELSAHIQDIETFYLLDQLEQVDIKTFVKESMVQIQYMSQTLSDFRNFLKPSTYKTFFSIQKSFDDILEIIGKQLFYSNIKVNINSHYENKVVSALIYGYENEFKQVLLNIINNAKNKIVEQKSNNSFEININISTSKKYNIIEISDNGGIIDPKIMHTIFEPYFTTKKEGMGFGLYMAKVIIEDKMSGIIRVDNRDNLVVFTIKIPHVKGGVNENIIT